MPGDGNDKGGGEVQQQLNDALTKLGGLETELGTLKDAKGGLERQLDEAQKELLSESYLDYKDKGAKGKDKDRGGGNIDVNAENFDFENATNAEIAAFMGKKTAGELTQVVSGVDKKIGSLEDKIGLALAQIDVSLTMMKHDGSDTKPSFSDNQDAIFKVAKDNPKWGAEKCYQQFVLESEKAAKDTAEAEKKKADEDAKTAAEKGEDGLPGSGTQQKELTEQQAGELAYKKAFGNQKTT